MHFHSGSPVLRFTIHHSPRPANNATLRKCAIIDLFRIVHVFFFFSTLGGFSVSPLLFRPRNENFSSHLVLPAVVLCVSHGQKWGRSSAKCWSPRKLFAYSPTVAINFSPKTFIAKEFKKKNGPHQQLVVVRMF